MTFTIRTNRHHYELKCWHDLPKKVQKDFDYTPDEGRNCPRFVRYKRGWYDTMGMDGRVPDSFPGNWDQYQSDSFSSGIVVRYVPDTDYVQIGTYFS